MSVDEENRIVQFEEKPAEPTPAPGHADRCLASMGIYAFNTDVLKEVLIEDAHDQASSHDFGQDIIPKMVRSARVFAYNFRDNRRGELPYWRDIGTIDAYWEANMDLVAVTPTFNLYEPNWPIRTFQTQQPPAKFVFADIGERFGVALDSIVSQGCIVSGGVVKNSVLSPTVRVNSYSRVERSILFDGADVGRYSDVRNAIVEKGVRIPAGTVIGYDLEEDSKRHFVTPGGVVVVQPEDFGSDSAPTKDWREDL
jgi:glucose-1-phosphate adenylyltransferase